MQTPEHLETKHMKLGGGLVPSEVGPDAPEVETKLPRLSDHIILRQTTPVNRGVIRRPLTREDYSYYIAKAAPNV